MWRERTRKRRNREIRETLMSEPVGKVCVRVFPTGQQTTQHGDRQGHHMFPIEKKQHGYSLWIHTHTYTYTFTHTHTHTHIHTQINQIVQAHRA